jgi:REP element-mobilizing transposase RayT
MNRPIVIGYHLIWTAYGWWLPNDPRGSGSTDVCTDVLARLGEIHYGRKKIQPAGRVVREFYEKAAKLLKHQLLKFDEAARQEIGNAFAQVIQEQRYSCYGCVVMPDHVHILIRKHKHQPEQMIESLKEGARLAALHVEPSSHRPSMLVRRRLEGFSRSSRRNPAHHCLHRAQPPTARFTKAKLGVCQTVRWLAPARGS